MKIQSLQLKNFRCFEDMTIDFHEQLTVLVGVNGSGKTAILAAINAFFSEVMICMQGGVFHGWELHTDDMENMKDEMMIEVSTLSPIKEKFRIKIAKDPNPAIQSNPIHTATILHTALIREPKQVVYRYFLAERHIDPKEIIVNPAGDYNIKAIYKNTDKMEFNYAGSFSWFLKFALRMAVSNSQGKKEEYIPEYEAVKKSLLQAISIGGKESEIYEEIEIAFDDANNPCLGARKKNSEIPDKINQLSQGYKAMLSLVLELAWRMGVANGNMGDKILHSPAIVLIDEIELHLHPSWQQTVLPSLMEIFPNTQFIVTTHSPQILTSIPSECIRILKDGKIYGAPAGSQGAEASRLLKRILGVDSRPPSDPVTQNLEAYKELVYSDKWDSEEAKKLRQYLDDAFKGEDSVLTELDLHIDNRKWELEQ